MDSNAWNQRYAATELLWSAGPNRFVVEQTTGLAPGRALDVACGEGRNAIWLAEQGWSTVAVDFSDVAIGRGRKVAAERGVEVDFRVGDVTETTIEGTFDLILVSYLQLPSEQLEPCIERLRNQLNPGGTIIVLGHHIDNIERGYGGPKDPSVLHDPELIASWLGDLELTEAGEVARTVETDDGEQTAIDSLVVARAGDQRS